MKKVIITLGICAMIAACSSPEERAKDQSTSGENQSATAQQSSADTNVNKIGTDSPAQTAGSDKGKQLIEKSDCLTCHKVDVKLIGPSYNEVATKYEATDANIEMLVSKIIKGGAGNWGEIPMTPHPDLSSDDAKEMAKYILSLN